MSAGAPATLSFTRPAAPYVCLGYHRGLDEVDHDYCRANGLPVLRRMVGGGPVYLDADQLFFQICLPARAVAGRPAASFAHAARTGRDRLCGRRGAGPCSTTICEICVGDRKICGHGAGQIEDAVVLCGNLIERFDHERAARVLALTEPGQRDQTLSLDAALRGARPRSIRPPSKPP